jgi:hypothetical protein
MIGFISTLVTSSLNHTYYRAITDLHTFLSTVPHALGFPVFTSCLLATDLNTETSISNHYEVFLPFLVQSPWNLITQLKTLFLAAIGLMLHSCGPNSLTLYHLFFLSGGRAFNVCSRSHWPSHGCFFSLRWLLSNRYHCSLLKASLSQAVPL